MSNNKNNKTEKKKESTKGSEELKEPISACMNCGSTDLGELPKWENLIGSPAMGGGMVCGRCGHRGIPIVFETEDERFRYEQKRAEHWKELKSVSAYAPLENMARKPWLMVVLFVIFAMFVPVIILLLVTLSIIIVLIRQKRDHNQNLSLIVLVILFVLTLVLCLGMIFWRG